MKINCFIVVLLFLLCNAQSASSFTIDTTSNKSSTKSGFKLIGLRSYENNILGYTFDSDDKPFIDFTLSARACIYPFDYLMNLFPARFRQEIHLNFAFSGRFSEYAETRYSSPVIGKRFNPYLFIAYYPKYKLRNTCFETGYGHESNGQVIDDSATFFKTAALKNNDINGTIDYISRGWDYFGGDMITDFFPKNKPKLCYETDLSIKYYLSEGLFEGTKEEYRSWESAWSGANYKRNDVSGIAITLTCFIDDCIINRLRINYETGIAHPLLNNSIKLIVGFKISTYDFAITGRYGYNGDLAQYGKLNSSVGIYAIIPSVKKPVDRRKN